MNYLPIQKLKYKDPAHFQENFQRIYHSTDTLHFAFKIHENPAFLVKNTEVLELISVVLRLDKKVTVLSGKLPPVAHDHFSRNCLIDEIVYTNDIEGVNSTRREIRDILDQAEKKGKKRFKGLVNKYQLLHQQAEIPFSSCKDIRTLYDELVSVEVAEDDKNDVLDGAIFRKGTVDVVNAAQVVIHHGVSPESEIIVRMENALQFLNDEGIDPLLRMAGFHYFFGYIHPFYNGNGRVSRFISSYLLSRELNSLVGYRLSFTIKENLNRYYEAFKLCNDPRNMGDITPFCILFLEIVAQALSELAEALTDRYNRLEYYAKLLQSSPFAKDENYRQLAWYLLLATLFEPSGISMAGLESLLKLSRATIKNRLNTLAAAGYLQEQMDGREKFYRINLDMLDTLAE